MAKKVQEQGICPCCGYDDLEYSDSGREDESIWYKWQCPECKKTGREYYDLVFSQHVVTSLG